MKRIIFLASPLILAFCLLLPGCKSPKSEVKQAPVQEEPLAPIQEEILESEEETTFVSTSCTPAGEFFTGIVFYKITKAEIIDLSNGNKTALSQGDFSYTQENTVISVPSVPISERQEYSIYVEGVPANPAAFVLHDIGQYPPLVLVEGKSYTNGKDYTYDSAEHRVVMLKPIDLNETSFVILWIASDNATASIVNKDSEYAASYDALKIQYLRSLGFKAN